jgi:hypothetical protein
MWRHRRKYKHFTENGDDVVVSNNPADGTEPTDDATEKSTLKTDCDSQPNGPAAEEAGEEAAECDGTLELEVKEELLDAEQVDVGKKDVPEAPTAKVDENFPAKTAAEPVPERQEAAKDATLTPSKRNKITDYFLPVPKSADKSAAVAATPAANPEPLEKARQNLSALLDQPDNSGNGSAPAPTESVANGVPVEDKPDSV